MRWLLLAALMMAATPTMSQAIVISACGTANYTPAIGQLHSLTMDPQGYLCVSTTTTAATEAPATGKSAPSEPARPALPEKPKQ